MSRMLLGPAWHIPGEINPCVSSNRHGCIRFISVISIALGTIRMNFSFDHTILERVEVLSSYEKWCRAIISQNVLTIPLTSSPGVCVCHRPMDTLVFGSRNDITDVFVKPSNVLSMVSPYGRNQGCDCPADARRTPRVAKQNFNQEGTRVAYCAFAMLATNAC